MSSNTSNLRETLLYFSAVAAGQVLGFLLLPILARALDPSAYGRYSLALAVSSFVGMIASAWVRHIGMRLYVDASRRGSTRAFFVTTSALQAVSFTAVYSIAIAGLAVFGIAFAPLSVLIHAGLMVVIGDLFGYAVTLLRAEHRPGAYAASEILAGVVRFGGTLVGLALGARDAEMLFDAASIGYGVGVAIAVPALWGRLSGPLFVDFTAAAELLRLMPPTLPFTVSGWVERLADRLALEFLLGTAAVGVYSIGYALGERIIGSLVQAVYMMAWPNVLDGWRSGGPAGARAAITDAQELFAWLTLGPTAFLVIYGPTLTPWIVGGAYGGANTVVPIVAAAMWIGGLGSYLNRDAELNKRFGRLSAVSTSGAVVNVALNLALIPRFGLDGAALATLANQAWNTLLFFAIRDKEITPLNGRPFAVAGTTALAAWVVAILTGTGLVAMIVFVGAYLIGAVAFYLLPKLRRRAQPRIS